jgi:hypothetical protein
MSFPFAVALETEFLFLLDGARPRGVVLSVRLVDIIGNAWCVLNPLAKCLPISWDCLKGLARWVRVVWGYIDLTICVCVYISRFNAFRCLRKGDSYISSIFSHSILLSDPRLWLASLARWWLILLRGLIGWPNRAPLSRFSSLCFLPSLSGILATFLTLPCCHLKVDSFSELS